MSFSAKQQKIVRRRKNLLIASIILFSILIGLVCFTFKSNAASERETYKYYTSYRVQPGDTLWSIAQDHMTIEYSDSTEYVREVKQINHMLEDDITIGDNLVIPYYSFDYK